MKVLCVMSFNAPSSKDKPRPEVGDEDVVTGGHNAEGALFYKLERFGDGFSYRSDHFATLPDTTSDEMEEGTNEAIINLETVLP